MSEQTQTGPVDTPEPKKKKGRSPSYPAITLEAAIQRAQQLWDAERQHPTPIDTIVKHWKYKSLSGPASLTLAALKKYGLIENVGAGQARRAQVTDLAVDILANPDEGVRRAAIQRAALSPAIHRELWDTFKNELPSNENLRWVLTRQRVPPFTETGADEFIPQYRHTLTFAQLTASDSVGLQTEPLEDKPKDGKDEKDPPPPSPPAHQQRGRAMSDSVTYAVPVAAGADVTVVGRFPLSEPEWAQFMAVLSAMKPALVADHPRPLAEGKNGD